MIITTPRLIVRPWERSDLDAMARWPRYPDPLDAVWNWPHMLHEQGTAAFFFLARAADPRRREWTITTTDSTIVGHLSIRNIEPEARTARLGISFGYPYIGQGYGYEAMGGFLDAFFGPLDYACMLLDVSLHNLRAHRLYQRLGFRQTRTFWYELGPAAEYAFLNEPRYNSIRQFIRWGSENVCMCYAEMALEAPRWQIRAHALAS
jgi:RimJ/RimL family protein N-acetyltransferase